MKYLNKRIFINCIFITLLLITNFAWYKIYTREQDRLKLSIIPSLSNDYFTKQLHLTEYQIKLENSFSMGENNYLAEMSSDPELNKIGYNAYFYTEDDYQNFLNSNTTIHDVPVVLQNPDYPNGCESASAVMLLNYFGIDITLSEFIDSYLMTDRVYEKDGNRYGPDPKKFYAGNPSSKSRGWGAFEPVIYNSIRQVLKDNLSNDNQYKLLNSENEKLPLDILSAFSPIIIWITQDYKEADDIYEWFSYDKKNTYSYPKNQHVVLLTGRDENYYYINDPLKGKNIKVEKVTLEKSFNSMGRQFIGLNIYKEKF